jgi:hypothetical protein
MASWSEFRSECCEGVEVCRVCHGAKDEVWASPLASSSSGIWPSIADIPLSNVAHRQKCPLGPIEGG